MKLTIAGIDHSTFAVDVVVLDWESDVGRWQHFPISKETDASDMRAWYAAKRVRRITGWLGWGDVEAVYIEKPFSQNRNTLAQLMRIQGAVVASLPRHIEIVEETAPVEWKRVFTGRSDATKEQIKVRALQLGFDPEGAPQDAYDAYGIAWGVRELNRQAIAKARALA